MAHNIVTGVALEQVPWVLGNPRILQKVYKKTTGLEDGNILIGDAKIRNP